MKSCLASKTLIMKMIRYYSSATKIKESQKGSFQNLIAEKEGVTSLWTLKQMKLNFDLKKKKKQISWEKCGWLEKSNELE